MIYILGDLYYGDLYILLVMEMVVIIFRLGEFLILVWIVWDYFILFSFSFRVVSINKEFCEKYCLGLKYLFGLKFR